MHFDLTHMTINLPQATILTARDSIGVKTMGNGFSKHEVMSDSQLPEVGSRVWMLLVPPDVPNPQPEKDKPFSVKYWDFLEE